MWEMLLSTSAAIGVRKWWYSKRTLTSVLHLMQIWRVGLNANFASNSNKNIFYYFFFAKSATEYCWRIERVQWNIFDERSNCVKWKWYPSLFVISLHPLPLLISSPLPSLVLYHEFFLDTLILLCPLDKIFPRKFYFEETNKKLDWIIRDRGPQQMLRAAFASASGEQKINALMSNEHKTKFQEVEQK